MFVFTTFAVAEAQKQKLVIILKSDEPITLKSGGDLIISKWADFKSWDDYERLSSILDPKLISYSKKPVEKAIKLEDETRRTIFEIFCTGIEKDSKFCDSFRKFQTAEKDYIEVNEIIQDLREELSASWYGYSHDEGQLLGAKTYLKIECMSENPPSYMQAFCKFFHKEKRVREEISNYEVKIANKVVSIGEQKKLNDEITEEILRIENQLFFLSFLNKDKEEEIEKLKRRHMIFWSI